jgi:hypothetical protein
VGQRKSRTQFTGHPFIGQAKEDAANVVGEILAKNTRIRVKAMNTFMV